MALYSYNCKNENCEELNVEKTANIPMAEYNEERLPKCEKCGNPTYRIYNLGGHQTFSDGYKG